MTATKPAGGSRADSGRAAADGGHWLLAGTNPVSRLIALLVMTTPLLVSVDIVSASVGVVNAIILAIACKYPLTRLAKRSIPLVVAVPFSGVSMLLYGRPSGQQYFEFGWIHITHNSMILAVAIMMRIIAIGLPAIVLLDSIDPTRLGDGLTQILHFPARFVLGTVAAFRLATLFLHDWAALSRSRRSRGLADDGAIVRGITMMFALLILALRRGGKLATAMEARGLGAYKTRTWARPARLGIHDAAAILICLGLAVAAVGAAIMTGHIRWFGV